MRFSATKEVLLSRSAIDRNFRANVGKSHHPNHSRAGKDPPCSGKSNTFEPESGDKGRFGPSTAGASRARLSALSISPSTLARRFQTCRPDQTTVS
jgi:hypothetical protein